MLLKIRFKFYLYKFSNSTFCPVKVWAIRLWISWITTISCIWPLMILFIIRVLILFRSICIRAHTRKIKSVIQIIMDKNLCRDIHWYSSYWSSFIFCNLRVRTCSISVNYRMLLIDMWSLLWSHCHTW
jgi:hypothetical protein